MLQNGNQLELAIVRYIAYVSKCTKVYFVWEPLTKSHMAAYWVFRDEMQGAIRSEWSAAAKGVAGSAHEVRGGDPVAEHLAVALAVVVST